MVTGLDVFAAHFAGDEAHYVLIGGVATQLVLEEAGLSARATRDLDIVLCIEALTPEFGEKFWQFVRAGGYAVQERSDAPRCFYRFNKPANENYPFMLELFAREPGRLPLAQGAHLTPVPFEAAVESLSAILLDEDYYDFIHANVRLLGGVRIVTEHCLIPLKARAWLDMSERRVAVPDSVDSRHLRKHRNDVLRLSQLLTPGQQHALPATISADVARFLDAVAPELSRDLLAELDIAQDAEALRTLLRTAYGVEA